MSKLPFLLVAVAAAVALTGLTLFAASLFVPRGLAWLDSLSKSQMAVFRACTILLPVMALAIVGWRRRRSGDDGS